MIYITGDVHDELKGHWEQKIAGSEINAAKKYLEILKKYKLKSTLFLNGITLDRQELKVKELLNYDIEIGGHTYNNLPGLNIFKSYIYRKIYKCIYGPGFMQKRDILKTKKSFEKFGLEMISWRTHAFGSNNKTFEILSKAGIKYVSDLLGEQRIFEKNGIIHVPINIPVDNNTICVGPLKPENRDVFASCTKGRIKSEEWLEIIKKRVVKNEKNKIESVFLIHPITMAVLDNFILFEKICEFLSKYKSGKISDIKIN